MLAQASTQQKNEALIAAAKAVRASAPEILAANAKDMEAARARNLSGALLDRLKLDEKRVESIATAMEEVVALPDPDRFRLGGMGSPQWSAHPARARTAGSNRHHL